ncbi:MAG TPA: nicotinate (nicotinamide) nucleotide adenylyltransferase [Flavitalea sp.]|nr:nicotinate (nicotinamide) nucleotide adenylyltransferase [Flavitalea sp.]
MKVGLYFGSFNPIHNGHLIIATYILQNTPIEQVWFVISPQNPLKKSSTLLNEYHRLYLVQVSIEDEPALKASDIEFRLPRPSYTIDTLAYFTEKFPTYDFSVIMGSDSYQNLPEWKNYKQLLSNYAVFVYERPGFKVEIFYENAQVNFLKAPLLEISSTYIRKIIREGKSIRYLVPEKVRLEIEQNRYYRNSINI